MALGCAGFSTVSRPQALPGADWSPCVDQCDWASGPDPNRSLTVSRRYRIGCVVTGAKRQRHQWKETGICDTKRKGNDPTRMSRARCNHYVV
jgi:hypothetical protein